jgi:hypothetical protein
MAVYVYRLAYRHQNGEVEGFVGVGFEKKTAERAAVMKALAKVRAIGQVFRADGVIRRDDGLSPDEVAQVRQDWKTEGG